MLGPYQLIEGVSNLVPGATYWWNATVIEPCIEGFYFDTPKFTQPDTATLNYTITSPTSATLRWNNLAAYGGQIAFGSYPIERSVNNGSWTPITTISNVSLSTGNVSGLSPGADYAFEINPTDVISGASAFTVSNKVLVSSSNVGSSNTTTAALTFGNWVLIGLGVGLAALLTAIVLAVRREPPQGPGRIPLLRRTATVSASADRLIRRFIPITRLAPRCSRPKLPVKPRRVQGERRAVGRDSTRWPIS